jgi:acid phosphatase (class A)
MNELNEIVSRMAESTEEDRQYSLLLDSSKNHYQMWADLATELTGQKYDLDWFWEVGTKAEGLIDYLKVYYNRPRPYQLAPQYGKRIQRIISDPRTASYPSGHAFDSWMFATLLSRRHPKYFRTFAATAEKVSDSRMVGGVHFRSDLMAGKQAAIFAVENGLIEEP